MSIASIVKAGLKSKAVRNTIGRSGVRIFKANFESRNRDNEGRFLGWLWNSAGRIVGLVGSVLGGIAFSFTALWGFIVSTVQYVWNFNWNMTDQEIDSQIQSLWNNLGSLLGGAVGNAFGYLACGVLPSATIFVFNEPMGAYLLANVAEEMKDEIVANVNNLVRYSFISGVQSLLLWGFKNVRKFLKNNPALLRAIFGSNADRLIRSWGEPGSKPWSFAKAVDDAVESIPNTFVRNFVEEFLEEAWDGCVEAGYVVANSLDSYIAQQKINQQFFPPLGPTRYVEVTPDRSNDKEKIILAGNEQVLKQGIIQTLGHHQLIENRDVGSLIGMPVDDYLRARPQTIRLVVTFYSVQTPPWTAPEGQRLVRATYAIPDISRSKLDWATIKNACGGTNGYMWGRFLAIGNLDNGRQMQCYGATPDEAEDRLRALLALSDAELLQKPNISEDRKEDISGSFLKKPTRVFPAFFTIMNQYKIAGGQGSGIPMTSGLYNRKDDKFLLWVEEEPIGYTERINEILQRPGADTSS